MHFTFKDVLTPLTLLFPGQKVVETLSTLLLESTLTVNSKSTELRYTSTVTSLFQKSSLIAKRRKKGFPSFRSSVCSHMKWKNARFRCGNSEWNQGRSQGGPGVPVTPLLQAFFNQSTYNRWRKCHDDILAIVKKPYFWTFFFNQSIFASGSCQLARRF